MPYILIVHLTRKNILFKTSKYLKVKDLINSNVKYVQPYRSKFEIFIMYFVIVYCLCKICNVIINNFILRYK